uniref:NAD(P)-binding domain-containing protein n=1 Tax=Chlamydomonas leiostraca TaxID=1034604 RepID=A0A7S0WUK6_9CHLO|mmetsp:Transcript_29246/g.74565  ORF Transcript_29246/g.74565 Transcript_29246/m.74565 type:complete len:232 (+) Transcript_29246:70-765(+)|eukprot:CAMPEP_0202868762 /NCGR_PEP_ID=MMETSP1391-20130828/11058_1 /ASSEMBLY_ACC=CAM_ASM_000867 /TAXON_ID=1034604 /ORGANISM="Chlamydomonas leiostraca, Strain SAG 11-49" /LENGTH=231 /DNA_ID=CAMNT_0049548969 /DNA_START=70 /DNA_END=765 /DNA_ORIENTATION=-
MAGRKAVVVGATGATGEHVLGQLLMDGHWQTVVAVGRRDAPVPPEYPPDQHKAQLQQVKVNMDALETEAAGAFAGADAVFCCLGTTRAAAGSAEAFLKVDYGYVCATARAAKAGGAPHFALVSSAGANANMWANDWKIFHSLLYPRTKGQAEEYVKSQGFASCAIYRPGLLLRGDKARGVEKAFVRLPFLSSLPTTSLARSMVADAKREPRAGLRMVTMDDLLKDMAAAGQ